MISTPFVVANARTKAIDDVMSRTTPTTLAFLIANGRDIDNMIKNTENNVRAFNRCCSEEASNEY